MNKLRSPIQWFGGKGNMIAKIVPILEKIPHRIYVEPFGGGASILLAKKPKPIEIYNDMDSGLHDFFTVLTNSKYFKKFYRRISVLPYSREFFNEYKGEWQNEEDLVERVCKWYFIARQSFGGIFGDSWGFAVTISRKNMASTTSKWLSIIEMLPEIHKRLQRVQIEHSDWRFIIDTYDTPEVCFYMDPPYMLSTRKGGNYEHELTEEDHQELIEKLLKIKGNVVLSGYNNELYKKLENAGWNKIEWQTACSAAGKTKHTKIQGVGSALKMQPRTEVVWVKPYSRKCAFEMLE